MPSQQVAKSGEGTQACLALEAAFSTSLLLQAKNFTKDLEEGDLAVYMVLVKEQ